VSELDRRTLGRGRLAQSPALQRRRARQQFVEQHAQGVDVRARVHAEGVHLGLLGAHVLEGADQGAELREQRPLRQPLLDRLGDAEVDDLGHRLVVVHRHEHVGRFDVAVDDPLLVGVLDGLADRHEQLQPLARRQPAVVAKLRDGDAVDQLHDEIGPAARRGVGVEDAGDVLVVHERQGLPLRLEAGEDLPAVHAGLDDLQGNLAANRMLLLGHVDDAHAAFADLLEQLVRAEARAGAFAAFGLAGGVRAGGGGRDGRLLQEAAGLKMGGDQLLHLPP
jgi:hypothetical protein